MASKEENVVTIEGRLVRKLVSSGSKSEHTGYAIVKEDGQEIVIEYLPDERGNELWSESPTLNALISERIAAEGEMYNGRLLASRVQSLLDWHFERVHESVDACLKHIDDIIASLRELIHKYEQEEKEEKPN